MPRLRDRPRTCPGAGGRRRPLPAQAQGAALPDAARAAARPRAVPAGPLHPRAARSTRARTRACRSFQENDANRFFGRIARDRRAGHPHPRPAADGGGRPLGRRQVVVRARRPGARAQALGRGVGDARHPPRPQPAGGAGQHRRAAWSAPPPPSPRTSHAQQQLVRALRSEPGYVGSVLRSRARRERRKILLFVDQFEELYTLVPDASERLAFTACLSGVADDATSPLRVVLSIRSDFLDRVPEDERFMAELTQGLFFLTAPSREGLRDALVQPAEMAGYRFEAPAMVEDMLQHLETTPGALPLLAVRRHPAVGARATPRAGCSPQQSYEAMGGIAGALASHADSVLAELPVAGPGAGPRDAPAPGHARSARARSSRWRSCASCRRTPTEMQRLIDQLVQARLLVVQTGGGATGATVEIVHESLIHSWPTLRRWLDEDQEDSGFMEQLRNAARQWQAKGRDVGPAVARRGGGGGAALQAALPRRAAAGAARLPGGRLRAGGASSTRRSRALVVGAGAFLVMLVAASAVALVVIRKAQQEAEKQAVVAKVAEARRASPRRRRRRRRPRPSSAWPRCRPRSWSGRRRRQEAEAANAQVAVGRQRAADARTSELLDALKKAKLAQLARQARQEERRAERARRRSRPSRRPSAPRSSCRACCAASRTVSSACRTSWAAPSSTT